MGIANYAHAFLYYSMDTNFGIKDLYFKKLITVKNVQVSDTTTAGK